MRSLALAVTRSGRQVVLLSVLANGSIRRKLRRQPRHAFTHHCNPLARQAVVVAIVETRDHLTLQDVVQLPGLCLIPCVIVAVFLAVAERPADIWLIGLSPPSVEFREVHASVWQHLHSAGAAGLPWTAWSVDPDIDALDDALGQQHVVVHDKNRMLSNVVTPQE